jgi:zinc transport system substrate-binding protein
MKLKLFIVVTIFSIFISGCQKSEPKDKSDEKNIVIATSFLPVYLMTQEVLSGIENVTVHNIAPSIYGCPHSFSLSTGNMKIVSKADIIVRHGAGMDPFLASNKLKNANPSAKIVVLSNSLNIDAICSDEENHDHHDHTDDHESLHAWVAPDQAILEAIYLTQQLAILLPDHKNLIVDNGENFVRDLKFVSNSYRIMADSIASPNVILMHNSFSVLAKEMGWNVLSVVQENPDIPISPRDLKDVITLLNSGKVEALFSEPQISQDLIDTIVNETGATVYNLDPIVNSEESDVNFIEKLNSNLTVIRKALVN